MIMIMINDDNNDDNDDNDDNNNNDTANVEVEVYVDIIVIRKERGVTERRCRIGRRGLRYREGEELHYLIQAIHPFIKEIDCLFEFLLQFAFSPFAASLLSPHHYQSLSSIVIIIHSSHHEIHIIININIHRHHIIIIIIIIAHTRHNN